MRQIGIMTLCLTGAVFLSACDKTPKGEVNRALQAVNAVDDANLSDIMLTVADPNEAVTYFQRTAQEQPDRADIQRGLAQSLVRAKRPTEAVSAFQKLLKMEDATLDDQVDLADAQIRASDWDAAEKTLDKVPPTHETFKRYRLEAMVADANKEWKKADSFYETAVGLTTRPAGVLNNWAYYLSVRGEQLEKAEEMSRRSNELSPGTATYMDTYAWILFKEGKYTEAREWQEKALRAEPVPDGVLLEHYGDILFKLNDTVGAVEQWKKAKAAGGASDQIDRKVREGKLVE